MDKKSIIGLLVIGAILFIFSMLQAPDSEVTQNNDSDQDTITNVVHNDNELSNEEISNLVAKLDENNEEMISPIDSLSYKKIYFDTILEKDTAIVEYYPTENPVISDSGVETVTEELPVESIDEKVVTLENDLLKIDITNQGGRIQNVFLKKYTDYNTFLEGTPSSEKPLQLFDKASTYGIQFIDGKTSRNSAEYGFKFIEKTKSTATVEMINPSGKIVGFRYALEDGQYDVKFSIYFKGFSDNETKDISFTQDFKLLSTEKHLPSERRIATVFYKYKEDSYNYLSIGGDDELEIEESTDWVAFKQSYFTTILMSETGFKPSKNSIVEIINLEEEDTTYIKQYRSNLDLGLTNMTNQVDLKWYFGPNDYDILAEYGNGCEDIVDLGWGLFRWINVYAMRPMFNFFVGWGWGVGFAILLLTIVVKIILSPINYKMYKSSAMMKVLKPEIEKLTKKFPGKENAMKKQQATMALYKETGVSPMAGCVPMLIQMPILFAIFRLFPCSLELRQQGFLWAEDLSSYDSILNLGFEIPFYGDHVSLFTLLMAVTTLAYTHYNSSNMQQPTAEGMPNMKYIMYFFPFLMIFFFNSYSSGLSFYYFISTLMTIGIMFAIKKYMLDEDKIHAKIEATRSEPKKKGKSKFAQRLEEAQKVQQEKMKNRKK